eukprot:3822944-Prymnesium_polylepis.2
MKARVRFAVSRCSSRLKTADTHAAHESTAIGKYGMQKARVASLSGRSPKPTVDAAMTALQQCGR